MDSAAIALVLATLGVNFGWQPAEGGPAGYEYTVQIEPEIARMLERGEAVPIESIVPPEVTPIRKVRIVVGRDELPRQALAADARKLDKYVARDAQPAAVAAKPATPRGRNGDLIVRGQSPDDAADGASQPHATAFAGETSPWANQPVGNANVDRYGNPIDGAASSVAPPPGFVDKMGTAVNSTARVVGEGLERGFADANAKLNQAGEQLWQGAQNSTQNAAQQFQLTDDQLRSGAEQTLDAAGNQLRRAGHSLGLTGNQPPPSWSQNIGPISAMPVAGGAPVRTATGWTTIGGNIAAPPVLPPALATSTAASGAPGNGGTRIAMNDRGPNFPIGSSSNREPLNSVLSDPAAAGANSGSSNTVPIRPVDPSVPTQQQSNTAWSDPWGADPWPNDSNKQPLAENNIGGTQAPAANTNDGFSSAASNVPPDWSTDGSGTLSGNGGNTSRPPRGTQTSTGGNAENPAPNDFGNASGNFSNNQSTAPLANAPAVAASPQNPGAPASDVPWKPLLFTGIGLVGSLSANFFLGWSYMDARQRYASLARKTAHSFRRRADAA